MNYYKIAQQKMQLMGYAENTQKIYLHYINQYLDSISESADRIKAEAFQNYISNYKYKSDSHQNQVVNALKFFWFKVLGKKYLKVEFHRPRKARKLPKVIASSLILSAIENCTNKKHKCILMLGYSVGLRVSEVCNLKIQDIDSKRMMILVRSSKGKKDRYVPLSENVLLALRAYYAQYKPKEYLFEGQNKKQYSHTSCNAIVKQFLGAKAHFHQLRHSFATTLVERCTDLPTIAKIMGHNSIKTTMIYTHVSNAHLSSVNLPI